MFYEDREVFPSAPLQFVAAEVRFPYAPRLRHEDGRDQLIELLGDLFPIPHPEAQLTLTLGPGGPVEQQTEPALRLMDVTSSTSVTVTPRSLALETTTYREFPDFVAKMSRAVAALGDLRVVAGVERIGLRYIDEIRVPAQITNPRDWAEWLNPSLLPLANMASALTPISSQSVVHYRTGEQTQLLFRAAALVGTSVVGDGLLRRRRHHPEGPFFVLDFDSFWQPADVGMPDYDPAWVMSTLDSLHEPTGALFQQSITQRLKDEVFRREENQRD